MSIQGFEYLFEEELWDLKLDEFILQENDLKHTSNI